MNNKRTVRVRFLIMLAVLVVVALGYFTTFGIGTVCGIGFDSITLLCPLGSLLAMIAERSAIPMAIVSIVAVLIICVVLGKVFCSWVCPVHFLSKLKPKSKTERAANKAAKAAAAAKAADDAFASDADATKTAVGEADAEGLGDKSDKSKKTAALKVNAHNACAACAHPCGKSKGIKIDSRHGVLAAALLSTGIFGFPVFCIICPVGLTFISVMLIIRLFAFGEATWTIVLFVGIILAEVILLPRWCSHFCPLGALFSLFSGLNKTFRPQVDESKCLHHQGVECNRCVHSCPEGINLHDIAAGETTINDCSKCKVCSDVCPAGAISFPLFSRAGKLNSAKAEVVTAEAATVADVEATTTADAKDANN